MENKVLFLDMRHFFLESKIFCTNLSMKSISVKETSSCNKGFFQSFPYTIESWQIFSHSISDDLPEPER